MTDRPDRTRDDIGGLSAMLDRAGALRCDHQIAKEPRRAPYGESWEDSREVLGLCGDAQKGIVGAGTRDVSTDAAPLELIAYVGARPIGTLYGADHSTALVDAAEESSTIRFVDDRTYAIDSPAGARAGDRHGGELPGAFGPPSGGSASSMLVFSDGWMSGEGRLDGRGTIGAGGAAGGRDGGERSAAEDGADASCDVGELSDATAARLLRTGAIDWKAFVISWQTGGAAAAVRTAGIPVVPLTCADADTAAMVAPACGPGDSTAFEDSEAVSSGRPCGTGPPANERGQQASASTRAVRAMLRLRPTDVAYAYDLGHVARLLVGWRAALPRVTPHYAVKCNPTRGLLAALAAGGAGFDCATAAEIEIVVRHLGVSPSRVVYAHPCKPPDHLALAAALGVPLTVVDDPLELPKVRRHAPAMRALVRVRADDPSARCGLGNKFGCDVERDVPALAARAAALGVQLAGVSFHVGSAAGGPGAYAAAVCRARHAWTHLLAAGHSPDVLDVGGGFAGGRLAPGGGGLAHTAALAELAAALDDHFPTREHRGLRVIAEPGRFFAEPAASYACRVVGARGRATGADGGGGGAATGGAGVAHARTDGGGDSDADGEAHAAAPETACAGTGSEIFAARRSDGGERAGPVEEGAARLGRAGSGSPSVALPDGRSAGSTPRAPPATPGPTGRDYYLADGVYGSMNCLLYDHATLPVPIVIRAPPAAGEDSGGEPATEGAWGGRPASASPPRDPAPSASTLFGPTCDGLDVLAEDVPLPRLHMGDWLAFECWGAYTVAGAVDFNGFPVSAPPVSFVWSE